jgi:hypothetical protein
LASLYRWKKITKININFVQLLYSRLSKENSDYSLTGYSVLHKICDKSEENTSNTDNSESSYYHKYSEDSPPPEDDCFNLALKSFLTLSNFRVNQIILLQKINLQQTLISALPFLKDPHNSTIILQILLLFSQNEENKKLENNVFSLLKEYSKSLFSRVSSYSPSFSNNSSSSFSLNSQFAAFCSSTSNSSSSLSSSPSTSLILEFSKPAKLLLSIFFNFSKTNPDIITSSGVLSILDNFLFNICNYTLGMDFNFNDLNLKKVFFEQEIIILNIFLALSQEKDSIKKLLNSCTVLRSISNIIKMFLGRSEISKDEFSNTHSLLFYITKFLVNITYHGRKNCVSGNDFISLFCNNILDFHDDDIIWNFIELFNHFFSKYYQGLYSANFIMDLEICEKIILNLAIGICNLFCKNKIQDNKLFLKKDKKLFPQNDKFHDFATHSLEIMQFYRFKYDFWTSHIIECWSELKSVSEIFIESEVFKMGLFYFYFYF